METENPKQKWIHIVFSTCLVLFIIQVGSVQTQEEADLKQSESNFPEEVTSFYRIFLEHYVRNQERISDLRAIRSATDRQRAQDVGNKIRERMNETLAELRKVYKRVREKGTNNTILKSMRKVMEIYPIYVNKVIGEWEPTDQQVLKRRRMSENEIVNERPELAGARLLRHVFLGELLSGASTVPGMDNWFEKRISKVRSWIRSNYNKLFTLFVRLVSRVDRVKNNKDKTDKERQQVIKEVRTEWNRYWREMGEGTNWQDIRRTVTRLRSLFRNRANRLPGAQAQLNEVIRKLQSKIGHLKRLQASKPFSSRVNRLEAMLQLSKAFVNRANELGDSQESRAISSIPMMFIENHVDQPPEQIWKSQQLKNMKETRDEKLEEINAAMADLEWENYKEERKKYNFPIDAIQNIVRRLGTNYGKKEQEIARTVRDMSQYVQAMYQLSTDGVDLMTSYRDALQEVSFEQTNQIIQFEKAFRKEHQSTIQNLKGRINIIRDTRDRIDEIVSRVRNVKPEELAAAKADSEENTKQSPSNN